MKTTTIACLMSLGLAGGLFTSAIAAPGANNDSNRGVLNGPLMKGGHKASGEGDAESLKLAIEDLIQTYGSKYPKGQEFLDRLGKITNARSEEFNKLKKEALLANPVLDFDSLLMVRTRRGRRFTANWETKASLGRGKGYDDELVLMSPLCDGEVEVVYKADSGKHIGDIDLHFDANRVLYSSQRDSGQWEVFEIRVDPATGRKVGNPRQVTPDMGADIDNYDACYLPDDRIIFGSTAAYEGVPCVGGAASVANLHIMKQDGSGVRRLCFDQDGNWHPVVMENGRVMFTRWEYTDSAHYFSRVLMTMNPDGTDQKAFYGSNSYWPNSMFFARGIPGHPSMFISTITGHHSHSKGGALCLFDVAKGRHEADGAIQFITGRGKKVEPLVIDDLARAYSPKFFHPFPLNDKYFIVGLKNGVYLADVFDNLLCLKAKDSSGSYFEPIPLRKTPKPFMRPDSVRPGEKMANVLISDIYEGPGLKDVPRGTVKAIRVFRYEYGPRKRGSHYAMGMETCWDSRQIVGTVPVESDGSASFMIPANAPISLQPVDENGMALQIMRSWLVGMPGERLSCIGCHESQNMPPPTKRAKAMFQKPRTVDPWFGPMRGFSFAREVMPVIDRYCAGCHNGKPGLDRFKAMGVTVHDRVTGTGRNTGKKFSEAGIPDFSNPSRAFDNLHPYVRRNGPEGDYHVLTPLEFHADTSELVQMLRKGHHNVKMPAEAWDRLVTWMDLNAPFKGNWIEAGANKKILERRKELRQLYAGVEFDPDEVVNPYEKSNETVIPKQISATETKPVKPVVKTYQKKEAELNLGDGVMMKFVSIPAGEFSMGSNEETPIEQPVCRVKIGKAFMMGTTEVTMEQYRQFDPDYLNGVYDMHYKDQVKRGYYMNDMQFPVIRVSWIKALEFCEWLSKKSGRKVKLPTEAQWEWACRAGSANSLSYGNLDSDFSKSANMADLKVREMAVSGVNPRPMRNPSYRDDFELKDPRFNDGVLHLAKAGSFEPNPWGLYDMHGNAAEWTRSIYAAYPYRDDRRNKVTPGSKRVVRGGSWHDRPFRCTASFRLGFLDWQRVYHTGFRVVIED